VAVIAKPNATSSFHFNILFRSAVPANAAYLEKYAEEEPERLAKKKENGPEIVGAVYIHPSATVDPTAKVCSPLCFITSVLEQPPSPFT
jgi:hypothetical protein